jgi:hypothetical protein
MKPRCARHAATPSLRVAAKALRRDRILDVGAASGGRLGMAYERHADIGGVSRLRMLNDFRARRATSRNGIGLRPSEIHHWHSLRGYVRLNDKLLAEPTSVEPHWSLGEATAHASRSERLYADEFFGSGTLPGAMVSRRVSCFRSAT